MSIVRADTGIDNLFAAHSTAVRGLYESANPAASNASELLSHFRTQLQVGVVTRSGAGLYDATVQTRVNPRMTCVQLSTAIAELSGYGVDHSQLIPEGSTVYIWRPDNATDFGIIIGAAPPLLSPDNEKKIIETRHIQMLDCEPGAADFTEKAYSQSYSKDDMLSIQANGGRPIDLMPGDTSWINELGVGMTVRRFMTAMFATDKCKMELFLLDDLLRLVSGQYQHFSAIGEHQIYNSNGNVTMELTGSSHQCEVAGFNKYGTQLVKDVAWDKEEARQADKDLAESDQVLKRRFQMYLGHLGGMFNFFIAKPKPDPNPNTYKAEVEDEGLAHVGIDSNGSILLRSAGDIVIQRNDHIPVPKKKKEPWDPEGDGYREESKKEPFKWGATDVRARPLQSRDAISWYTRMLYQPLIDNSNLKDKKDFHLANEGDQPVPADKFDELKEHLSDYNDTTNANKRSEIILRKDGGITMRDSKGAEISLIDGKVIISAPEGIEIRSGKDALVTALSDVILKAKSSVDITATEKDVRLKAENNMQLRAQGILLESSGESEGQNFDNKGEAIYSNGIIMRAKDSRIFLWAKTVHIAVIERFLVDALGTIGDIIIACKKKVVTTAEQFIATCGGITALLMNKDQAVLHAKSTGCIGQTSAFLIKGDEYAVPLTWVKLPSSPFDALTRQIEPIHDQFQNQTAWLEPYTAVKRPGYKFSFRTDIQYGTASGTFKVYESLWAFMARKDGLNGTWVEPDVNGTTPWPGKPHYNGITAYNQLNSEVNIENSRNGLGKKWLLRTAEGSGFTGVGFDKYQG